MHELTIIIAKYFVALPVIALPFLFLRLKKDKRIEMLLLLILSSILTVILVKIATTIHQDPRPFVRDGVQPFFVSSKDNGFPSDHTALSALIAFLVCVYSKKLGIALLVVSLLIGISRVISGVHHAQDILGGVIIAGLSVLLSMVILYRFQRARLSKNI